MTRKTTKSTKPAGRKPKRLSLSKKTLKDLTPRGQGPAGGKGTAGGNTPCPWGSTPS
jgi:hypothetical protein